MDRDAQRDHDYEMKYGQDPVFPTHSFGLPCLPASKIEVSEYLKSQRECLEALADLQSRELTDEDWYRFERIETERMMRMGR